MEWWHRLLNAEVLVVLLIFGLPAIAVICGSIVSILTHRSNNDLKRTMIRQGMSADDIERVIKARPTKTGK